MNKLPIKETVKAKGHTPQYRMHKYFARRPYNVFRNLIKHYTDENDIVLDCFCGGGVTVFESLVLDRKVIGVDINPLATFITKMQIQQTDLNKVKKLLYNFYDEIRKEFEDLYTINVNNEKGVIEWLEWAYEVKCPYCNEIIVLSNENKVSNGKYRCSNLKCKSNEDSGNHGVQRTECKPYSITPLRVKYKSLTENQSKIHILSPQEKEEIKRKMDEIEIPDELVQIDIDIPNNWDRWHEDCLPEKGIFKFSDFFTRRNLYINTKIFNKIIDMKSCISEEYCDILYFVFSSSLRYTNNMTRVTNNWEGGNPTSMDKHAYWLPNQFVETNVLDKFLNRIDAVLKGLKYTNQTIKKPKFEADNYEQLLENKDYLILTQSASSLPIPDKSVDVIITDPPYGSNVQYAELSSFWNVWYMKYKNLETFIYNEEEAVANRKSNFEGAKSVEFYGDMLYKIFKEANRVLKDDGYLVFTFNNKNINVWIQLLKAIVKAGFYLPEGGVIYQDFIKEYKNTSHLRYSGNIHGDFIYSFKKGTIKIEGSQKNIDYEEHLIKKINECITKMYKDNSSYTTTELYQTIFSELIIIILEFIASSYQSDDELVKIGDLSNTFIDDILNKRLILKNGRWMLRGNN